MSATLEQQIAAALTSDRVTSSELLALAGAVDVAIIEANATAKAERERALDPALSPDPRKARQAMEDAQFAAARLRVVLPRLHQRQQEVAVQEHAAQWEKEYLVVEAETAALAAELSEFYPATVAKLTDLLNRIAANDRERSRVASSAAAGEPRRITGAEVQARGYFATGRASLTAQLQMPAWEENKLAWPPPRPSMVETFAPAPFDRRFSDEWWRGPEVAA